MLNKFFDLARCMFCSKLLLSDEWWGGKEICIKCQRDKKNDR